MATEEWVEIETPPSTAPKIGKFILPEPWHQHLVQTAQKYGVDPHFAQAVMAVESNYKPSATSKKGAMGLMQLMPQTARAMGVQDPYDPYQNIEGGVKLLGELSKRFGGDLQKVAWVYNAGSLGKANPETSAYVPAVMAAYRQASQSGAMPQQAVEDEGEWVEVDKKPPGMPSLTLQQEIAALPQASPEEAQAAMGLLAPQPGQPGPVQSIPGLVGQALSQDPMAAMVDMTSPSAAMQGLSDAGGALNKDVLLRQLPVAGMIAGGVLGNVPGAALGAGAGKAGELYLRGRGGEKLPSIPSQALQVGTSMATGATAEMGGQIAGKALEGVFAPGKKWLEKQIASVELNRGAQELAAQGVPISPKTIAPSAPARAVHWLAERFQPGKSIVDSYRKKTMDMIYEMRRNLVDDLGLPSMGAKPLGSAKEEIASVFNKFREALGPNALVPMVNTKTYLDNLQLTGKAEAKDIDFLNALRGKVESGTMTVAEIEKFNSIIWPKGRAYGKMSVAEKEWRDNLITNLFKDLEPIEVSNSLNLAELLKTAKGTTRDIYQAQYIEKLLGRATNDEQLMFNPQKFYDIVKNNENQIYKNLDKDVAKNLFRFAEKVRAAAPERAMHLSSKETPSWWEQAFSSGPAVGLAGGALYTHPAMAIPIGFQAIVARSLMSPKGVIRKWLTTGFGPPKLPTKIGIMKGLEND